LRQSFDNLSDGEAAYILSSFASDPALVLGHLDCDEKSNEIPAVQALLRQLGVEQALLTIDGIHCQKTFEEAGAVLIAQGKDNQPTLLQRAEQVCRTTAPIDQNATRDTRSCLTVSSRTARATQ
jgi:predicted transposase YbfD/YdcC